MYTRRGFLKTTAYAGIGFTVVSALEPLTAFAAVTPEEKDALKSGDPRKLRQLGVHGMLCLYIKRLQPEFRDNIYWKQK